MTSQVTERRVKTEEKEEEWRKKRVGGGGVAPADSLQGNLIIE